MTKPKKPIKAWAVIIKKVSTGKDSIFKSGIDGKYKEARIFRTKKQARESYPNFKITSCKIIV